MNIKDKILVKCVKIKNDIVRYRTKKIDKIEYYFDELIIDKNSIFIRGWILSKNKENISPSIKFSTDDNSETFDIKLYKREDVCKALEIENINCGFQFEATFRSNKTGRIYLQYVIDGRIRRIVIGAFIGEKDEKKLSVNKIISGIAPFNEVVENVKIDSFNIPDEIYNFSVDIIVPVYNGFDYLERLFKTIEQTDMKYRLFIIDDKSPDERVLPFLTEYAKDKENVFLFENSINLGFVQSVNKALSVSDSDVAIVNTDVILPDKWLERLMIPIILRNDTASSTPFTNSGTICSFPVFCDNNDLFLGLDIDEIDNEFLKIKPVYNEMPTGVGFCMGMKRNVINEIGIFDAEVFYKGYGEENDWCQRAIEHGYKNVHVENLFVWHKHGGSFLSEDKKRYIERNFKLLLQKHPNYEKDVALYCKKDPAKNIREYVKWQLISREARENYVIFNHNWGGGAITYINDRIKSFMENGFGVIQIIGDANYGIVVEYNYKGHKSQFAFKDFEEVYNTIKDIKCKNIIINELVSFENLENVQNFVQKLKEHFKAKLTMLGHDFYAVCPSIYLMNDEDRHCFKPKEDDCRKCFENNSNKFYNNCASIDEWRKMWQSFLKKCDEIILFSENTKTYFEYWYEDVNISVLPHQVNYIRPVRDYSKSEDKIIITVIGNLMKTKGSDIIYEMSELIKKENINAEIVVIGPDLDNCKDKSIIIHGKYSREELPDLIEKYKSDVIFIASIWPETFSYTTEEAIKMNMPVAAFNIGAPAERLAKYDKGIIIDEISAKAALDKIIGYVKNKRNA